MLFRSAEYAFIQSDNAISSWSELDLSAINSDLGDLGPDFDLELLGIKNFSLDPFDAKDGAEEIDASEFEDDQFSYECPKCGFMFNDKED